MAEDTLGGDLLFRQLPPGMRLSRIHGEGSPILGFGALWLAIVLASFGATTSVWAFAAVLGASILFLEFRNSSDYISQAEVGQRRGPFGRVARRIAIQDLSHVVWGPSVRSTIDGRRRLTDLYFHSANGFLYFLEVRAPEDVERALRLAGWTGQWRQRQ
jgi:hypothetical protein